MTGDLGNGKFDGAWLVSNFENLNPANTLWRSSTISMRRSTARRRATWSSSNGGAHTSS